MKHEALFSKKNRKLLTDPLNDNNPVIEFAALTQYHQ